ncbi:hypothetical protein PHYPO_G00049220 [Pangasianodon hypophthalmus]|uniref:Arf-GAP domain-containing protein n=1 Tax=Pangasianodon hypophthalmus TaxID=310915 RepID=A0A5N5M729_PANHP|nr:hypothetical protein PHYPO_G00049220 [Pangasianodon hypophthalmus]
MAASAKRKQEEKHLKMLREMTSLPPNRKCFDCDQRGPTYANMTTGSFVCTSCSGILRGLNPPHRVKSISMTTFTQQEIEFLQKHGNEVCKQIWLGLYDDRSSAVPDFREPQKVKEFLQEKYEKKRWYVPPDQAKVVASVHASMSGFLSQQHKQHSGSAAAENPAGRLGACSTPEQKHTQPVPCSVASSQSAGSSSFANFANFNSHPAAQNANASTDFANFDAFGSSAAAAAPSAAFPSAPQAPFQPAQTGGSAGLANANFANFDNFPKSCSADFATYGSAQANCSGGGAKTDGGAVPADRYAALADLDNIFSSAKSEQGSSSAPPSAGVGPPPPQAAMLGGDRYAALAALDTAFSAPVPSSSSFGTATSTPGSIFGAPPGVSAPQPQQAVLPQGFGGPSTNPFVSTGLPQAAPPSNPFQANGRPAAASFGPGSMSMPAGFSNTAAYNLPTSFSGNFQQAFPGQGFPQPQAYAQQPNGSKAAVAQFGQNMAAPGVTNNPFLAGAPVGQYPAGGSSTNPFL